MVRTQRIPTDKYRLLVGSDQHDSGAARGEIQEWADRNGYRTPSEKRVLTVVSAAGKVREWTVLESEPTALRVPPPGGTGRWTFGGWGKRKAA